MLTLFFSDCFAGAREDTQITALRVLRLWEGILSAA